jgi:hypothetical protein
LPEARHCPHELECPSMAIVKLLVCRDPAQASFVCDILKEEGIRATVMGEQIDRFAGLVPTGAGLPSVWVNEEDLPTATAVLARPWESPEPQGPWVCPSCGEEIEPQYSHCWNCQASRDGSEKLPAEPDEARPHPAVDEPASPWIGGIALLSSVLFHVVYWRQAPGFLDAEMKSILISLAFTGAVFGALALFRRKRNERILGIISLASTVFPLLILAGPQLITGWQWDLPLKWVQQGN